MTNEELVLAVRSGKDTKENMQRLYLQNKGMIVKLAYQIAGSFTESKAARKALQEELEQESYFGLDEAARHWKQEEGTAFITYAVYWIRRAMIQYALNTSSTIRVPADRQRQAVEYKSMIRQFLTKYGRPPTDQEIIDSLQIEPAALKDIKAAAAARNCESIEKPVAEDLTLSDMIQDQKDSYADLLENMESAELRSDILEALEELPELQRQVINRHYLAGKALKEVSQEAGITYSDAIKARDKGMKALRSEKFRKRFSSYAYSLGLQCGGLFHFARTFESGTERAALILCGEYWE